MKDILIQFDLQEKGELITVVKPNLKVYHLIRFGYSYQEVA